ncbi:MAG: VCBS repeat-containing protein [Candidatus Cloacimonetes bacterium]|nr:VCBS repeat-containing protein [Candidatus Cloacimonadota bacterium]
MRIKFIFVLILLISIKYIYSAEYTIPRAASSVYAEDIDLDGDKDIIVGHNTLWEYTNPSISILTNDGNGNFTISDTSIVFCGDQQDIFAKRLNDDDYPDLITFMADFSTGEAERYIRIFYNEYGIFESFSDYPLLYSEPVYLKTYGDIDDDDDLDIIVAANLGQRWGWLSNNGNGEFSEPSYVNVTYHPGGLACGDLNNNGRDDIVVCGTSLEVYLSIQSGFEYVLIEEGIHYANDVEIADIDNDGYEDLIVSEYGSPTSPHFLSIYYNDGNCNFNLGYHEEISYGISDMTLVDLNNDNNIDIIYSKWGIYIYIRLNVNGTFAEEQYYPTNLNAPYFNIRSCYSTDLDGNGWNDIITVQWCNIPLEGNLHILFNNEEGDFVEEPQVSAENYELQISNYELQNHPNPFNPVTTISYNFPANIVNPVIEIFNIKGETIRKFNCQNQIPIIWDGTDNSRNQVASGVYLYRIKSDEGVLISKKMLLLK